MKIAGLTLTLLMMAQSQGIAQVSPAPAAPKPAVPAASFIPTSFNPPVLVEGTGFKLVPLGPEVVKLDFDAYMSSIEHLEEDLLTQHPLASPIHFRCGRHERHGRRAGAI